MDHVKVTMEELRKELEDIKKCHAELKKLILSNKTKATYCR